MKPMTNWRRGVYSVTLAGLVLASGWASAATVVVGRDQALQFNDQTIVSIDVLGSDQVGGDVDALLSPFAAQGVCLTYAFDDQKVLNYDVRLALFDASGNIVDLPIVNVTNGYFSGVDTSCGVVNPPIPVPPPNNPPVAVDDPYGSDFAGKNVLSNDFDPDGDLLTALLVQNPQNGSVQLNPNGTFTYTPNPDFQGVDSFVYRASDGTDISDFATVSLEVILGNRAPVAVDDSFGADITGRSVLTNDSDPDDDPLTAVLVSPPTQGSFQFNPDGTFSYVAPEGFVGTVSFTYRANDGELDSNIASATFAVDVPNSAPVAVDDSFGQDFAAKSVLDNDSDPDGDKLAAELESGASNGVVSLSPDGTFTYVANVGFFGEDSFTYRASDGELVSDIATVTFSNRPTENVPPQAQDATLEGGTTSGNVLDNAVDPNGDELIAILVEDVKNGRLQLNADGSFEYTPFAGFIGEDRFVYKVRDRAPDDDAGLESNPANVNIILKGGDEVDDGVTGKVDEDGYSVEQNATPNELILSRRIDDICPRLMPVTDGQRDLKTLCGNLRSQGTTARQAVEALKAITPEEYAVLARTFKVLSLSRFRNLGARIARVREGSRGLSIAGLNINMGDTRVSGSELDAMLNETLASLGGGASADEANDFGNLGLFIRGDLNFGDQDETALESAFDFDAQSLTVGADYRITDNLFGGASVSFGWSEVDFDNNGGKIETDNYAVSVYGSYYTQGSLYFDGIFNYGWSEIDTERNIVYRDFGGTVDRQAQGSTDGDEIYVSFNGGYNFNRNALNIDPGVRFFYMDGNVDGFTESGAGGWDLAVDDQSFKSISLSANAQVSYTFTPSWGVISPYARLEYTYEFEDDAQGIRYRFANDPFTDDPGGGKMRLEGQIYDSSYLMYTVGVASQFIYGISGFATYQVLGGYDDLSSESLSVGLRWELTF